MEKQMKRKIKCETVVLGEDIGKYKAKLLSSMVQKYMQNPEHQKGFEKWYLEKYGVPYGTEKI